MAAAAANSASANGRRVELRAGRSGTADNRVPRLSVIKVTSDVASLGRRDCGVRGALSRADRGSGGRAGVSRGVPVPFNSHWRVADKTAQAAAVDRNVKTKRFI